MSTASRQFPLRLVALIALAIAAKLVFNVFWPGNTQVPAVPGARSATTER